MTDHDPSVPAAVPEFGLHAMTGIGSTFRAGVDYTAGMALMEEAQRQRRTGLCGDTVLYFEHPAVITRGRATPPDHIRAGAAELPVIDVPRGGQATYHGPGQLVGYPIIDLARRPAGAAPDVHQFLRAVEEGIATYLGAEYGLHAFSQAGHTGVWVGAEAAPRKIASIGISVRRWVSGHGFALNVDPDLRAFEAILPCGLDPGVMTSVERELRRANRTERLCSLAETARRVHLYLCEALRRRNFAPVEECNT